MKCRLPGTAATCASREVARQQSVGCRRESAGLLVPHMNEVDIAAVDRVSDLIHRIATIP